MRPPLYRLRIGCRCVSKEVKKYRFRSGSRFVVSGAYQTLGLAQVLNSLDRVSRRGVGAQHDTRITKHSAERRSGVFILEHVGAALRPPLVRCFKHTTSSKQIPRFPGVLPTAGNRGRAPRYCSNSRLAQSSGSCTLNSLCRVLFNCPSQYCSTIGLIRVLSLPSPALGLRAANTR